MTAPFAPIAEPALDARAADAMLLFRIGGEFFALPLRSAEEAVESLARESLPGMPEGMLGVATHRGRRLPVYSPTAVLGATPSEGDGLTLVVRTGAGCVGLAVDDVEDVMHTDPAALRPVPGPAAIEPVLLGVVPHGAELVAMCDPEALVRACLGASR